jgi:hypothetical protein
MITSLVSLRTRANTDHTEQDDRNHCSQQTALRFWRIENTLRITGTPVRHEANDKQSDRQEREREANDPFYDLHEATIKGKCQVLAINSSERTPNHSQRNIFCGRPSMGSLAAPTCSR